MPKIKNIIIFVVIAVILILAYVFLFKKSPEQANLVSSTGNSVLPSSSSDQGSLMGKDFLSLLLNVENIKLDDTIFTDPAFATLHDSTIELIQDGNEGRPNPFAPLGSDISAAPINANALYFNIPPINGNIIAPPATTPAPAPAETQ